MNALVKSVPTGKGNIRCDLPLTQERAKQLLSYNQKTGTLKWKVHRAGNARPGDRAGAVCGRYITIQIDSLNYRAHRIAWFLRTGSWPSCLIDHKNGDGMDNRWVNLRQATYSQNAQNRCISRRNKSGQPGVCLDNETGKWLAEIGVQGKNKRLGRFQCLSDAVAVRCEAERHHFGAFARDVRKAKQDAETS
ncbi:MAG: HNH endonuclease [Stappiaceae bacterium]